MRSEGLADLVNRNAAVMDQWLYLGPIALISVVAFISIRQRQSKRRPERTAPVFMPLHKLDIDVHLSPPSWDDVVCAQRTAKEDRSEWPTWWLFLPPGIDMAALGVRTLYEHRTAVAPLTFVRGSLRRNWSPSRTAQDYAAKVRLQGRDLVAEEVRQLEALQAEAGKDIAARAEVIEFAQP